jgi:hypothetical protein
MKYAGRPPKAIPTRGFGKEERRRITLWSPVFLLFLGAPLTVVSILLGFTAGHAVEPFCPNGSAPDPHVIWCDDFDDGISPSQKYFEYDNNNGDFVPVPGQGVNGSVAMQVKWQKGEVSAGGLRRTFGRSPVNSQSHSKTDFKEIYWRQYLRMQSGWTGNPYKLSRATIFATSNWAQAMIAHLWQGSGNVLALDPASGINANGKLITRGYNDFANLQWLGIKAGTTPIFSTALSGQWQCVEAHAKLNTPGASDGVFEFWINGNLEAREVNLNWIGTWQDYGINAIFFENYWNDGAPGERIRYFDNIVISTQNIGCLTKTPPTHQR